MSREATSRPTLGFGLVDLGLVLTVLIWAVNFSVVKATLTYIPPLTFNTFRLVGASAMLLALSPLSARSPFTRRELGQLLVLGLVGHTAYQLLFIHGIHVTTASNSALMLAMTPVMVAAIGAASRIERVDTGAWVGIGLSVAGVYLVMGSASASRSTWAGDVLVLTATLCWSAYTVAAKPLLARHGPIRITAYSMAIGTVFYLPFAVPALLHTSYGTIPRTAWAATLFSFAFALVLAYVLWYHAVSRIGATRTAVFSNLTPAAALLVSWLALKEHIHPLQLAGAAVIFLGIHLVRGSRISRKRRP